MEAIKKQAANNKSKEILHLVDDIFACNSRGFCDENGIPLSNPEFVRNIDLGVLNECLKEDDVHKFLNSLGKSYVKPDDETELNINNINLNSNLSQVNNDESKASKPKLSLLEMQNGT